MRAIGIARPEVVHFSYIHRQGNARAYGHHDLPQRKAGARFCTICGRWVIRGMGRWWERQA